MKFDPLEYLRPKYYGRRRRMGSFHDGGYVVVEDILPRKLYTFGVGDETSFEVDFVKIEGATTHLYDHTVDFVVPDILRALRMFFHKQALAMKGNKHGNTVGN